MFKKNNLIIFIIVVIASLSLLWWSQQLSYPENSIEQVTGQVQGVVDVKFTFSDDKIINLQHNYAQNISSNLLTITQSLANQQAWAFDSKDYGEMGVLVTQIGDYKNGQTQKYWQFYVNGEQPMLSADKFTPAVGDQIEWRFAESKL